jgi:hypothetical protein
MLIVAKRKVNETDNKQKIPDAIASY